MNATPSSKLTAVAPVLLVRDVVAAAEHYRDRMGFRYERWASWHLRPASALRKLCFGDFRIHPAHAGMEANLLGKPL